MNLFYPPAAAQRKYFYFVDLMRGLASVCVLFTHYHHFFLPSASRLALSKEQISSQPLYPFLKILYDYGYYAVQFFWIISGFIFCAVYVGKNVSTRDFVLNRFARLYPLHFLTLIIVLVLQAISVLETGEYQIYAINDLYHFILNIFFASFWGLQKGYSFNGPIWSISVEVLIYIAFWITRPYLYRNGIFGPAILTSLAWIVSYKFVGHYPLLRQCGFFFLLGETIYLFFHSVQTRPAILASSGTALLAMSVASSRWFPERFESTTIVLLLAATTLFCCSVEATRFSALGRRVQWIGDATYGMYLWHIPVQIIALIIFHQNAGLRVVIEQPWFLLAYLVVVIGLARISFVTFERPMRRWIRISMKRPAACLNSRDGTHGLDTPT